MEQAWRWFGPKDPISLVDVREAGATGIVTALHQIPGGTAWSDEAIAERKAMIEAAGLALVGGREHSRSPTRSRRGPPTGGRTSTPGRRRSRALGRAGIDTVCYNFMPIVDWTRTDLAWPLKSGLALRFDMVDFAAYDVFVLQRPGADDDYDVDLLRRGAGALPHHARGAAGRNWSGSSSPGCPAPTSPMTGPDSSTSSSSMPAWGRSSSARASPSS